MPRTSNATPRLRASPLAAPLHVVLVEPENPAQYGEHRPAVRRDRRRFSTSWGRSGSGSTSRASGGPGWTTGTSSRCANTLDFAHFLHAFAQASPGAKLHLFTALADPMLRGRRLRPGRRARLRQRERRAPRRAPRGAPRSRSWGSRRSGPVRSLNLANAAGIALFEALRVIGAFERNVRRLAGWVLSAPSLERADPGHFLPEDQRVNVVRPLVREDGLEVTEVAA